MTKSIKREIITDIYEAFGKYKKNKAFVINDITYTYGQLANAVYSISTQICNRQDDIIGIVAENRLETYASILAVLLCGKTYVILHPSYPEDRNKNIAKQAGVNSLLHTEDAQNFPLDNVLERICTTELRQSIPPVAYLPQDNQKNAYIIFTSGSTGEPKGVPISRENLNAFYHAYHKLGWQLSETDRMLQMFELTFDVSVVSLLYPLTLGACIYTIPVEGIKYLNVIDILEKYEITFAAVAPSLLQLVRPYFSEIQFPKLKYLIVTAEASNAELLSAFKSCAPNAAFVNLYGPTEGTIYCTSYFIPPTGCKHHNGMVAIGKPFDGISIQLMTDDDTPVLAGECGELWISGQQVMKGYWNDPEKSGTCLAQWKDGKTYYKTGDLCKIDAEGDIIYYGRKDYQVKVQGFRIELSEIEYVARQFFDGKTGTVVTARQIENQGCELHLFVEDTHFNSTELHEYISKKLPYYMIPKQIHKIEHFPLNNSNKTDRKKLLDLIK